MMTNYSLWFSKREMKTILFVLILLPAALSYIGAQSPGNSQDVTDMKNSLGRWRRAAIVLVVAVIVILIIFLLCLGLQRYIDSNAQGAANSGGGGGEGGGGGGGGGAAVIEMSTTATQSTQPSCGLDAAVVETIPSLMYSEVKRLQIGTGELECGICLEEFEDDTMLRVLPNCDHVYHTHCIYEWLNIRSTCPICVRYITPGPDESLQRPESSNDGAAVEPAIGERTLEEQFPALLVPATEPDDSRMTRPILSRSQTTSHSLTQAGENTDRSTLKLSAKDKNMILRRARSQVMLRTENRSGVLDRGSGEGTSRGGYR
ncbi:E3 ubiquitin-protein ligase ATL6-like [Humulus lupulus]|uniref:E3 ubiquitin-protein ligase ATL6-like n=1 Tax=Humulus lupulus TaxID=3486 RepID=UPI002B41710E|nr:E3 ubiquitin-protein ligase ATL6-like [Humulus lupulus]